MALEEKNHAEILRSGKNYIKLIPDAFGRQIMTASEVKTGLLMARSLLQTIRQKPDLETQLKGLLELERRFEKVHLDTSVEIKDLSLKKLFQDLSQEDKTHIQKLEEIILQKGE
jgi:iron-sulfur cluster repair protein YtfE (RIC family)